MLSVRIWAPLPLRVRYFAQKYGVSRAEAERQALERDVGRRDYMSANYGVDSLDPARYDVAVNVDAVGQEGAAELIAAAARARVAALAVR